MTQTKSTLRSVILTHNSYLGKLTFCHVAVSVILSSVSLCKDKVKVQFSLSMPRGHVGLAEVQLHSLILNLHTRDMQPTLYSRQRTLVTTEHDAVWAPEAISTFWRGKNLLSHWDSNPRPSRAQDSR
jgi:hypothetical protein